MEEDLLLNILADQKKNWKSGSGFKTIAKSYATAPLMVTIIYILGNLLEKLNV
jgi:hypothetical protein